MPTLAPALRFSFHWWETKSTHTCPCGRQTDVLAIEPAWSELKQDGCWDTTCPTCGRVITLYDLKYDNRQPPRGPAPTQYQREVLGWDEDTLLARL